MAQGFLILDYGLTSACDHLQVQSMSCLFKMKNGLPHILHCDVAMSHPDTKPPMSLQALMELQNPSGA